VENALKAGFFFPAAYDMVLNGVRSVFPIAVEYEVWIPSFGYAVNYILGSLRYDPAALTADEVDKRLKEGGIATAIVPILKSAVLNRALFQRTLS
jgi:spermidine synthase